MFEEDYITNTAMKPCLSCDIIDIVIAAIWPFLFIAVYAISEPYLQHWFVVPVYMCGVVISIDAVRWVRGKMDTFDPRGLVGMFGCNFFVLSPILTAYYKSNSIGHVTMDDVRLWLGLMAFLNFIGILVFKFVENRVSQRQFVAKKLWTENTERSLLILPLAVLVIAACHAYFVLKSGGISAYIAHRTYGDISILAGGVGLGPINVIGRALPIMLLITITVWFRRSGREASFVKIGIVLFVFLVTQFLVAGMTGSRAAIMWALFWAVGIIHFFWRPIPIKLVLVSIIPLVLFLYLYGFYKEMGTKSFGVFTGQTSLKSLEHESKRTFAKVLVGDMGRSDVQAGILSSITDSNHDYDYWYGKTYLTSGVSMVPRRIWPAKPEDNGKVIAGSEILYGKGSYAGRHTVGIGKRATRIYGLAGEAMLNFGIWGILPAFAVWGFIVGVIRRKVLNYPAGDMRLLVAPYWMLTTFFLLIQDLDNFVETSVFNLLVPAFLVWCISLKSFNNNYEYAEVEELE